MENVELLCPDVSMTDSIKSLWREAFGDTDEFIDSYFDGAFSPENCRCAAVDGEAVSVIHLLDCTVNGESFAYVYAASTKEGFRGYGIFRRLMEDTAEYLKERSYSGMILLPGDAALGRMYEKLGFAFFEGLTAEDFSAVGGELLEVRQISADAYAEARKKYLPEGGVLMGESMVRFLERYAELYVGESFVFALAGGTDRFIAAEFLGDSAKIPSVLKSFGYSEGIFCCPEGEKRAMYRRFENGKPPALLGICFDI